MEEGRWDEANTEKVRLEEKQRDVRKRREVEREIAVQEGREYTGVYLKIEKEMFLEAIHQLSYTKAT